MKTKRIISVFLAVVMCLGMVFAADAETQIPDGYTPVYTAEDFNNIRNDLDGKYILMNDIDLSVYENWEPIGTSDAPFTGELDGDGYYVKNLAISVDLSESANYYYGMFGYIKNSKINNISAVDCGIEVSYSGTETARCNLGTIAGCGYMSEITDCAVSGKITTGNFLTTVVGGILGRDDMLCTLERCSNYSDIIAEATKLSKYIYVGGISGVAMGSKSECCNFGKINVDNKEILPECKVMVGGIDGNGYEASVLMDCYNRGDITIGVSTSNTFVGGISGASFATKNAYNTGKIILFDNFNGCSGSISGSIGTGGVSIPVVGMPTPYIENVYYSESDLPVGYAECLHPDDYYEDKYDSVYKSFAELSDDNLKKQESFVGFDFENVWEMEENGYPVLKNQPKVTVKKSVVLEDGEKYQIKEGKDYKVHSDSPLCVDYITYPENAEIQAIYPGRLTFTVIYDYGYTAEYDITITEAAPSYPVVPNPEPLPENNVESAEIVHVPLKNRIVFSAGSPESPDGIVLKLKYKDGTEKTETVVYDVSEEEYRAGAETVFGSERADVEVYGLLTDTLYINDNTVSVKYDYFVPPTLSYIFMQVINLFLNFAF